METEITLDELQSKTGFTKRQIYNWQQAGIIPEPLRRIRTGKVKGEIVYYPMEAYKRLRSIQYLPVSSMTRKVGIDSIFLPLFLFGFRDEKIDEGFKRLLMKAIRHFRIILRKVSEDDLNEGIGNSLKGDPLMSTDPFPLDILKPILFRFQGIPQKDIKALLPEDSSDEIYDSLSNTINNVEGKITKALKIESFDGDLLEEFITAFRRIILNYPSLQNTEMVNRLNKKGLDEMQAAMLFMFGLITTFGVKDENLINWFKKTNFIYGACLLTLISYVTFGYFKSYMTSETKDQIMNMPTEVRKISDTEEVAKPKRGRKKEA